MLFYCIIPERVQTQTHLKERRNIYSFMIIVPDSKVHGANMGPTWVLAAPVGPHVGPMNLAIRGPWYMHKVMLWFFMSIGAVMRELMWFIYNIPHSYIYWQQAIIALSQWQWHDENNQMNMGSNNHNWHDNAWTVWMILGYIILVDFDWKTCEETKILAIIWSHNLQTKFSWNSIIETV